ncbi:MAG: hypothetical protein KF832_03495 [Caldilineaceae bacterium]|nr:hypothetical protein [Caldilineaceae bacterium]
MSWMSLQTPHRRARVRSLHWSLALLLSIVASPIAQADGDTQIYLPLIFGPPAIVIRSDLWIDRAKLATLPTTGAAWNQLKAKADEAIGTPNLGDQDSTVGVHVLAKALVYARTGQTNYRDQVVSALEVVTFGKTEENGRTLALGRTLTAYIIAADVIDLATVNPTLDEQFRATLHTLLGKPIAGWGAEPRTLRSTHELRPNNWGTNAGASRIAAALYLGDLAELEQSALVFRGYLGDLAAYNGFQYAEDLSWQASPNQPVGINPAGATKDGYSIDGALPEEMRRGGPFQWPPLETNYPWAGLQGAVVQAELLARAGYPAWEWQDRALLRSVQFLYNIHWPAQGDDEWIIPLINCVYQTNFPMVEDARSGKNMGWTNWTHTRCS